MKRWSLALIALVSCAHPPIAGSPPSDAHVAISHAEARPAARGPAETFTGSVVVTQLFKPADGSRTSGGSVSFEPGARSHWHTHPLGQTLIITAGSGWVQAWGGAKQEMKAGDVVWTPPGVKHWHGATATESMTHTAIQENVDGVAVHWMEAVGDGPYRN